MKRLLQEKGIHPAVMFHDVRWGAEHGPSAHNHLALENNGAALQNHYHRIKSWLRTFVA